MTCRENIAFSPEFSNIFIDSDGPVLILKDQNHHRPSYYFLKCYGMAWLSKAVTTTLEELFSRTDRDGKFIKFYPVA